MPCAAIMRLPARAQAHYSGVIGQPVNLAAATSLPNAFCLMAEGRWYRRGRTERNRLAASASNQMRFTSSVNGSRMRPRLMNRLAGARRSGHPQSQASRIGPAAPASQGRSKAQTTSPGHPRA